jgi:hypothetical protein
LVRATMLIFEGMRKGCRTSQELLMRTDYHFPT